MSHAQETNDSSTQSPEPQRRFFPDGHSDSDAPLSSPVPLSQEESENEEIRALAAKLAPALIQADHALTMTLPESSSVVTSQYDDYDDDIDEEVRNLQQSEELMRQELEMAMDFDNFMKMGTADEDDELTQIPSLPTLLSPSPPRNPVEADVDEDEDTDLVVEETNESPAALEPIKIPSPLSYANSSPTSYHATPKLPPPRTPDKDRNVGQAGGFWLVPGGAPNSPMAQYRHGNHMEALRLSREERGCWYSVDLTFHLDMKSPSEAGPVVQEYCLAIPYAKLKQVFVGLNDKGEDEDGAASSAPLAARTLTIRIRPDVLCGAVMEGVHSAVMSLGADIQKRQGGHLQAEFGDYWVDFRLATEKSELQECARKLIVRVFHLGDKPEIAENVPTGQDEGEDIAIDGIVRVDTGLNASLHLKESAALVQRMEAPAHSRKMIRQPPNSQSIQTAVSEHLLEQYRACPSVRDGNITLPSLNADDFALIQKSWSLIEAVWEELDNRDLAFSTLDVAHFGAFPALPTLDVHYCSQLRRISREEMVAQLLKSATQLEEYAREAEYACANMISILKPTYALYGADELAIPEPIPLTAYPLEYTPPQSTCPPWGPKVQHALNEIPAWNDKDADNASMTSFEMAKKATAVVLQAFSKQDDEEQSARLQRKNKQVMDRLDRMTSHELKLVAGISTTCTTTAAVKASEELYAKTSIRAVPLLKWKIAAGGGAGMMYVTSKIIAFVTQVIPVVGSTTVKIFQIADMDFTVLEATPSLLNPFPTMISVTDRSGNEVYSFRFSSGGNRLRSLLYRLKENPLLLDIPS